MTRRQSIALLAAVLALSLASCSGGGSSGPTCSFDDPAVMPGSSPWPKFHHDPQNTGMVSDSQIAGIYDALRSNAGQLRWTFPAAGETPKGTFSASPVINADESRIYIGSGDHTLYALRVSDGTQDTTFNFAATAGITSTAIAAVRDGQDAIFVGTSDDRLLGLNASGAAQLDSWPFLFGGPVSASPVLANDGTVYAASGNGFLFGVCPNGIARFGFSVPGVESSPAIGGDGTVYFGADDKQLRALRAEGVLKWTFATSAAILTAPVVDEPTNTIYVADHAGGVFRVDSNGQFLFKFQAAAPITASSPALGGTHVFFGSDDGVFYALNKSSGALDWSFATGAAIASSPAVAVSGDNAPLVVVGSNDGKVYFLQDQGGSVTEFRTAFTVGASVHSPAIGRDGTVYIGGDDGRVYAIGSPLATPAVTATGTPGTTATPTGSGM